MLEAPTQPFPVSKTQVNGSNHAKDDDDDDQSSLTAAADLIRTLDTAFAEMSTLSASAARDAEDARRNARAASEVARRYTARSYPTSSAFGTETTTTTMITGGNNYPRSTSNVSNDRTNGGYHVSGNSGASMMEASSEIRFLASNDKAQLATLDENDATAVVHYDGAQASADATAAGRKRKTYKSVQSSSERLAQSHAEDVLSLSLELERTKQALETEQRHHDETRASLTEARCQNTQLDNQVQKILSDLETQREDHGREVDGLKQELKRAQVRVDAAEEDAQLALDLAKANADSREHVEEWLQRALQEVQLLRERLEHAGVDPATIIPPPASPGRKSSVRFTESPTRLSPEAIPEEPEEYEVTPRSQASRPMVAAGRQLLQRAKPISTPGGGDSSCHSVTFTPEASSERRNKLRERLHAMADDGIHHSPAKQETHTGSVHGIDMGLATKAMEANRNVCKHLVESGKKLGLGGHWLNSSSPMSPADESVEVVTRHYCHSVEAKIGTQTEELKELGALCDYLEQKLVVDDEKFTAMSVSSATEEIDDKGPV